MKVEAKWTGNYPNLCSGQWILKVNNIDVSHLIPEDLRNEPMNTYRTYLCWHFNNNWEEKEWLQTNPPTKDIDEQFPNQVFPQGEIQPYLK